MDILWSPWRSAYINSAASDTDTDEASVCVFCDILKDSAGDEEKLILHRGAFNFIILNKYPYISGHLMVVPFSHESDLDRAAKEITDEMMDLAKRCQTVLRSAYNPDGFNMGMNFGKAAGAGVAGHFHLHVLPRWIGDANFMTSISETRTIPEDLQTTYGKLKNGFTKHL